MVTEKNPKRIYISDYTGDDTIPAFLTFCIEHYKNFKNISGEQAFKTLSDAGVLDYLAAYYPSLHLESSQWLLREMDDLVKTQVLLSR